MEVPLEQGSQSIMEKLKWNSIVFLDSFRRSMLPVLGVGVASSYHRLIALHSNLLFAAYALVNADRVEQKDIKGEASKFPMFERTMHLQNAFVTYNNCVDYIYQVLFFYYDLDSSIGSDVASYDDIVALERRVLARRYDEFDKKIKGINVELFDALRRFRDNTDGLNEKANEIKHRASYWIDGNHVTTFGAITIAIEGGLLDLSSIVTPPVYDVFEEIEFLIMVHNEFIKLEGVLFEQLAFGKKMNIFLRSQGLTDR